MCNERKYLLDSSDGKVTTVDVKSFDGNTKSAYGIYADDWQSYGFELKSTNINVAGSDDAVNYGIYTDDSAPWTLEDILSGSPRGKSLSVLPKTSVSLCMMRP